MKTPKLTRRDLIATSAAVAGATLLPSPAAANWAAKPPAGFSRLSIPGKVVKVTKGDAFESGTVYPKADLARIMLERAMTELTGKNDLAAAFKLFVHPSDKVAIKPNGIAGRKSMKMATNKELVVAIVNGLVAAGVAPENVTIYEQYRDFLFATRCITDKHTLALAPEFPKGVKAAVHLNKDATMDAITVAGIPTKYVTPFTDATVVINVSQVKDHGICGFTGTLKNITHGSNINPHDFHAHNASPQIAHLYAQDVIKSRVALHITDAFQVIYDEGPIDVNPRRRVPFESIYASTDPVATDVIGWKVIERLRKDNGLPTLADAGREPTYLKVAGELGLGIYDDKRIRFRDVTL